MACLYMHIKMSKEKVNAIFFILDLTKSSFWSGEPLHHDVQCASFPHILSLLYRTFLGLCSLIYASLSLSLIIILSCENLEAMRCKASLHI